MSLDKRDFSNKKHALIEISFNLVIIVVILTLVIALLLNGLLYSINESELNQINKQIDTIISEGEHMSSLASSGSNKTINVYFPQKLKWAVFGKKINNEVSINNNELIYPNLSISNKKEQNEGLYYCYLLKDGTFDLGQTDIQFRSNNISEAAILFSGNYQVIMQLKQTQKGNCYVQLIKKD